MSWIRNLAAHAPFLMTVTPLFGAALCWLNLRRGSSTARPTAITNASLTVILSIVMTWNFSADIVGPQMAASMPWWQWPLDLSSPESDIRFQFAFGVDGVSLAPLFIVAIVGWFAVVMADRSAPAGKEPPYAGLLLGQSLSIGLFAVQEFAAWILCCELWAWWAFLMLGRHGEENRRQAARRVLLSARLAQVCWLLAGVGMAVCHAWIHADVRHQSAGVSFLYADFVGSLSRGIAGNETALQLWSAFGPWVLILWLAGVWLQWPLFPAHSGLGGLWSEARAPLAALCGTTMMLQGGYVWFRFVAPLLPAGSSAVLMLLSGCAGFGVLYFGLLALVQRTWRSLVCVLTLSSLQAAWLCSASGNVHGTLTGWRMVCAASIVTAGVWLLIGWRESQGAPCEFDRQADLAAASPRWFGFMSWGCGLLACLPCFSLISGQAVLNLLELRRRGVPHLMLMVGGVLSAWSVLRVLLQTGFPSLGDNAPAGGMVAQRKDVGGRDWLLAAPVLAGLLCLAMPDQWDAWLGPTWQRLHDPFSTTATSSLSAIPATTTITANKLLKPVVKQSADFPWLCAPLFWGLSGALLCAAPRDLLTPQWARIIALLGLAGGGLAEWLGGMHTAAVHPQWAIGCVISLVLTGFVEFAVVAEPAASSAKRWGALLLRISGISLSAMTGDLLYAGLAWELAEFGRWCAPSEVEPCVGRRTREQLRHFLSSFCFWLGLAVLAIVTRTTHIATAAAKLAEMVPRNEDGQILGVASRWGLASAILICSGIGIRCGLLPWSFSRRRHHAGGPVDGGVTEDWLDRLAGLAMFLQLSIALGDGFGGPLAVLLAIAAAITAVWNSLTVVGESKVSNLLHAVPASQFAALILMVAGLMAKPAAISTGFREQFDLSSLPPLVTYGTVMITLVLCGLVVLLRRLGKPEFGELYLDHYRGLFSRRALDAALLASLLICLTGGGLFVAFLPAWIGLTNLMMTPLPRLHVQIQPHPVLMAASVICLFARIPLLGRMADWMCRMAFDQPVALPAMNSNRWQLFLAFGLTLGAVIGSACPALLEFILSVRR